MLISAIRSIFALCFLAGVIAALQPRPAAANLLGDASALYVFGDSLSDTGNVFAATAGFVPPVATYNSGRFSNGPVWTDTLGVISDHGQTPVTLGVTPGATGVNFAFGGATTGALNVIDPGLPGLSQQVGTFQTLLSGGALSVDTDALFVVWAGANDYLAGGVVDPTGPVANLATAISALYGLGARHFIVPNLPDLGATPLGVAVNPAGLSALTDFHNLGLATALDSLAGALPDIAITALDVHQLFDDVLADPAAFGFDNTALPCLNAPIIGVPTGACPGAGSFDAGGALFWDPLHPTSAAHAAIAGLLTVPEPSAIALFGIGIAGIGLMRRRSATALPVSSPAAPIRRRTARILEAGAAIALLIYFAPCLAVVAVVVRMSGPGPLFQWRTVMFPDGRKMAMRGFRQTVPQASFVSGILAMAPILALPGLLDVVGGTLSLSALRLAATVPAQTGFESL